MRKIKYNFIIILQHFHEIPSCMYICIIYICIHICTPAHAHELFMYCVHYEMYKIKKKEAITNDQLVDIIVINNFLVFTRNL